MSAHTPGPWKQHLVDETLIVADDQTIIASTSIDFDRAETAEANARLIAVAPDLLASLKDCRAVASMSDHQKRDGEMLILEVLDRAFEIISKAEGR